CRQGDEAAAQRLFEESLALYQEVGDRRSSATVLEALAEVAAAQGDKAAVVAHYRKSLALYQGTGSRRGMFRTLRALARAAVRSDAGRAVRWYAAAEAARAGGELERWEPDACERDLAAARAALGEERFSAEWAAGSAMTLEEAIADALRETGTG